MEYFVPLTANNVASVACQALFRLFCVWFRRLETAFGNILVQNQQ